MRLIYDKEVDALSITFRETTVTTKHLAEGIAADYDSEGQLAGLEILDVGKRFGGRESLNEVVLQGFDPSLRTSGRNKVAIVAEEKSGYPNGTRNKKDPG